MDQVLDEAGHRRRGRLLLGAFYLVQLTPARKAEAGKCGAEEREGSGLGKWPAACTDQRRKVIQRSFKKRVVDEVVAITNKVSGAVVNEHQISVVISPEKVATTVNRALI